MGGFGASEEKEIIAKYNALDPPSELGLDEWEAEQKMGLVDTEVIMCAATRLIQLVVQAKAAYKKKSGFADLELNLELRLADNYLDEIYDCLHPDGKREMGAAFTKLGKSMFTDSSDPRAFTAIPITSKLDFWRAFKKGMATRKVGGATHSESSRSHFSLIFSVTRIERKKDISTGTWKVYNKVTSYLSVSDLAGSEKTQEVQSILKRQHASPAKLALGLKESKEINSALEGIQVTMDRIRKKINKSAKEQKEPVRQCVYRCCCIPPLFTHTHGDTPLSSLALLLAHNDDTCKCEPRG